MIALDGVAIRRSGRLLLDDVTLRLEPGALTVLLGPNGAGKSTLLGVMAGDLKPDSGAATLEGRPLADLGPAALARRRAVMMQAAALPFDFTVGEMVELGRLAHAGDTEARHDGEATADLRARLGLAPLWSRRYSTLSGGERQKVQFARALAQLWSPAGWAGKLLLLDEPTAALDLAQQQALMSQAADFARDGGTVMAITHDPNLALRHADHALLLRAGRLAATGPAAEVLTAESLGRCFGIGIAEARTASGRAALLVG